MLNMPCICLTSFVTSQLDDKRMLVFGGLNKRTRYNDVWVLNLEEKAWTQIEATPDVEGGGVPEPRAHFTATKFGDRIFVFGGYGGSGNVFNDMWVLHIEEGSFRWENISAKIEGTGESPLHFPICICQTLERSHKPY